VGRPLFVGIAALAYAIDYLRGFTRQTSIRLNRIERVVPVRGGVLTQPRLIVHYRTHDRTARRRITLPSRHLSYGDEEFEKAKRVLAERGLGVEWTDPAERLRNLDAGGRDRKGASGRRANAKETDERCTDANTDASTDAENPGTVTNAELR
jgi:hypothetical protein